MILNYTIDMALESYSIMLFYIANDSQSLIAENVLKNLVDKFPLVKFYKTDISEDTAVADKYSVYSVPKLVLFKDGEILDSILGLASIEVVKDFIQSYVGE